MIPEKQILVIGEACGWTDHFPKDSGGILLPYKWCNTHTNKKSMDLPDYLNDLNAMYIAEQLLFTYPHGKVDFSNNLLKIVTPDGECDLVDDYGEYSTSKSTSLFALVHTTAAQRAEAFLKTIGKWEEKA